MSPPSKLLPVAILAGGQATRLRPATAHRPKSLMPIAGEPFLAHQLRLLRASGIDRVVLCIGYLGDQVRAYARNGSEFGLQIEYASDGDSQLGTGGAIRNALPLLPEQFFVLYGDSYLPCDYRAVERAFSATSAHALMTIFRNGDRWDRSNVEYVGGAVVAYDKCAPTRRMRHIDYGLGVFRASAFERTPIGLPVDLSAVYQALLRENRLTALEVRERFYETGSWDGIRELEEHLSKRRSRRTS